MKRCPYCNRILPAEDERGAISQEDLRKFCLERKFVIFAGDRVDEKTAAALLGKSNGTLRNWRGTGRPLPYTRSGAGRGRPYYHLKVLAEFLNRADPE